MGLVRAAASGGCAAACAAPKGLRARLRLERLRRASLRATQILACAAAHPRCSVMRACHTPTQVLEWSRKLASELLLGAIKLPCAADQSTHPATASFALIRRRRAFRVITKTFPWRDDRDIDVYHWSSAKFSSTWHDTFSILLARGRAQVSVAASRGDWSKRTQDQAYSDQNHASAA